MLERAPNPKADAAARNYRRAAVALSICLVLVVAPTLLFLNSPEQRLARMLRAGGLDEAIVKEAVASTPLRGRHLARALANIESKGADLIEDQVRGGDREDALYWVAWIGVKTPFAELNSEDQMRRVLFVARKHAREGNFGNALATIEGGAIRHTALPGDPFRPGRVAIADKIAADPVLAPVRAFDPARFDASLALARAEMRQAVPPSVWQFTSPDRELRAASDHLETLQLAAAMARELSSYPIEARRLVAPSLSRVAGAAYGEFRRLLPLVSPNQPPTDMEAATFNELAYYLWEMDDASPGMALMALEVARYVEDARFGGSISFLDGPYLDTAGCAMRAIGKEEEAEALFCRAVASYHAMEVAPADFAEVAARLRGPQPDPPGPKDRPASARLGGSTVVSPPALNSYVDRVAPLPTTLAAIEAELRAEFGALPATGDREMRSLLLEVRSAVLNAFAVAPIGAASPAINVSASESVPAADESTTTDQAGS